MNSLPPSKRTKLDPSPSPNAQNQNPNENNDDDDDDLEQAHCTICLQSFLDRTILPACAHEFCFECILLWSEQSRKCPLCSRSFDDGYFIHRIRSQYDYQKHYLPPSRSSPLPPLTESRINALRNTRRERRWGRRQRQQRAEADQLERAIARRRWIYQHHLYAKHIASNPYTRYRPFPTAAQFSASPDLISRMTTFLRRELRVWPNLDVEFLTTYTISLMKSIDIRSESAVKLLSEFLDLDTPYTAGERNVNAEHFAHEIYSYLRSPYRDLNMYDETAQYETPPEISPPQEIERGRRWSAEPSSPRSPSNSRYRSPVLRRENNAIHSPATRHGRESFTETRQEDRPNRRHSCNQSLRGIPSHREDRDPRNYPSGGRCSPPNAVQDTLRGSHPQPGGTSYLEAASSAVRAETQDNSAPAQPYFLDDEKGKSQLTENMEEFVSGTDTEKMNAPRDDDSAAVPAVGGAGVTRLTDGLPEGTGNNYVDKVRDGSSANPRPSRKRSVGLNVQHPRDRTLSESVRAYLSRPGALPTKKSSLSRGQRPIRASDTCTTGKSTTDTHPSLLLRLTDGPTNPDMDTLSDLQKTSAREPADGDSSTPDHIASEQGRRSQSRVFSSNRRSSTATENGRTIIRRNHVGDGTTWSRGVLSSADDEASKVFPSADSSPGMSEFPPASSVTPLASSANDVALSHALAPEGSLVDGCPESARSRHGESLGQGCRFHREMGAARVTDDDDSVDLRPEFLERAASLGGAAASASLDNRARDHEHCPGHGGMNIDTGPDAGIVAAGPSSSRGGCETDGLAVGDDATKDRSVSTSISTVSELETRLRMRVRLAAMKGMRVASVPGSGLGSSSARRRGAEDDSSWTDRVRDEGACTPGGRDLEGGDGDRGEDGVREEDEDEERQRQRQREVVLRGLLVLRNRVARRG